MKKFKIGDMVNIVSVSYEFRYVGSKEIVDIAIESKRNFEIVDFNTSMKAYKLKDFGFHMYEKELEFADIDDGGL